MGLLLPHHQPQFRLLPISSPSSHRTREPEPQCNPPPDAEPGTVWSALRTAVPYCAMPQCARTPPCCNTEICSIRHLIAGLYGFDVRRPPSLHMQYWSTILARRPARVLFQHCRPHGCAEHLAPTQVPQSHARQRCRRHRRSRQRWPRECRLGALGEFLGTLEGADHWALRGASSIELDIDLPDAWSFAINWSHWRDNNNYGTKDEALKSSRDRLLAVVDWLVEQVPVGLWGAFLFAGAPPPDGSGGSAGASPHSHCRLL